MCWLCHYYFYFLNNTISDIGITIAKNVLSASINKNVLSVIK